MTRNTQSGFTLVELAIALMVIGLLIGGVLKGQELIQNAKVTATIQQIKAFDAATLIFKNTYGALPGDLPSPGTRISGCTSVICMISGNKNGRIIPTDTNPRYAEIGNFFPHLTKAGMLKGPEGGGDAVMELSRLSSNNTGDGEMFILESPLDLFFQVRYLESDGLETGNHYWAYWKQAEHLPKTASLFALDTKMDDGKPFTGSFRMPDDDGCPLDGDEYDTSREPEAYCGIFVTTGW